MRACEEASQAPPGAAIEIALRHLRQAAGADRAFLLEGEGNGLRLRVRSRSTARVDDATFSTQLAARALRGERPLFLADVRAEPVWADGASVRSLAIRSVLAAPLRRAAAGTRLAIVLDSRRPLAVDPAEGCRLVQAFGGLIEVLERAGSEPVTEAPCAAEPLCGDSPACVKLESEIRAAAGVPLPALVVGESGTGKELVARALHRGGTRGRRPFVAINCAAIPEALLERELFGAVRGAYTGADRDHPGLFRQAHRGTIFLDEIGDMPLALQSKLLRVLQEGTVRSVGALEEQPIDVRLIAATHRDLPALVAENRFRADLRWRLEVLVLRVPSLRERTADLPRLCDQLLRRLARRCALPHAVLGEGVVVRLAAHPWPGNVRELESVLARALLRARNGRIDLRDIDLPEPVPPRDSSEPASISRTLERTMIEEALRASRGNVTAAALRIGWSRQTLYRRIEALGLRGEPHVPSEEGASRSSDSSTFQ